jgi:haloalkane dehalogenase
MRRRHFLKLSSGIAALATVRPYVFAKKTEIIDTAWYRQHRRFADLSMSRVAYVERGTGPAALFVHGYPLNGYQWRGALERLPTHRRCIAPDVMGMGFTETVEQQEISPLTQVTMLGMLLDALHVDSVDLIANDSGGLVAQLFLARFPQRVRTILLTNCDVDTNNPPAGFVPFIQEAQKGTMVDRFLVPQLEDKNLARSPGGMGGIAYSFPEKLADETIETYLRPLTETPLKKAQVNQYAVSMGTNVLVPIREDLKRWKNPARIVWGMKDALFNVEWADWLDRTLPGSRGVRRVEGANLFFPEEFPDVIAEEALKLWGVRH